jgi:hypothetical protein
VPIAEAGDGLLGGMQQFKFMRALYGLAVSGGIAVVVTLLTRPEPPQRYGGLVWGTVGEAIRRYKGSPGQERHGKRATARPRRVEDQAIHPSTGLPQVRISAVLAEAIEASAGDLIHVSDRRTWLGGLHSAHAIVGQIVAGDDDSFVELGADLWSAVVTPRRTNEPVTVERLY